MTTAERKKATPRYVWGREKTGAHLDERLGGSVHMTVGPGNYVVLDPPTMRAMAISLNAMADEIEAK